MNLERNLISFFFLNLEKHRASHITIRKAIHNAQEITDHQKDKKPYFFIL